METDYEKNRIDDNPNEDISFGPIIAIIIIVTLIIVGGLYVWEKLNPREILPAGGGLSGDPVVNSFAKQSNSDNLNDIRKDLSATSIQSLDQGLKPITEPKQ